MMKMSIKLAAGALFLAASPAFASTPWAAGCAAPAPEIGVGVVGAILSVAAVKWFRGRASK